MYRIVQALVIAGLVATTARAEVGRLPTPLEAKNTKLTQLRSPTGHPCLTFREMVRPQIVVHDVYDQIVLVENGCADPILVRVCYRASTNGCQKLRVKPHDKTSTLLGSMYNQPRFAFDYTEVYAK